MRALQNGEDHETGSVAIILGTHHREPGPQTRAVWGGVIALNAAGLAVPNIAVHEIGRARGGGKRWLSTTSGLVVGAALAGGSIYLMSRDPEISPAIWALPYAILPPIGAAVGYALGSSNDSQAAVSPTVTSEGAGLSLTVRF